MDIQQEWLYGNLFLRINTMFLTWFSPFSEVNNDSETYDDDVSDNDDEDDAGEDQQNNDLPSNERVISSQIPVQQPAEDRTIIVESS